MNYYSQVLEYLEQIIANSGGNISEMNNYQAQVVEYLEQIIGNFGGSIPDAPPPNNFYSRHLQLLKSWRDHTSPDLAAYRARRDAVGDPVTAEEDLALRRFLYTPYPDGTGGTLRVADYISLFNASNALLAPFMGTKIAGCLVPLVGNGGVDFVNVGFVDGDRTPGGLQGDGQSWLETAIVGNTLDVGNCSVVLSHTSLASPDFEVLMGGIPKFHFYKNNLNTGSDLIVGRIHGDQPDNNLTAGTIQEGFHVWSADSPNSLTGFENLVNTATNTDSRVAITSSDPVLLFSLSPSGSPTGRSLLHLAAIASQALTDPQRTSLYHATVQLNLDREQLL